MLVVDFPTTIEFNQRKLVRRIAVNLVGGCENENRVRTVVASGLQHDQRTVGIDGEVDERVFGGPVVGRLGRGVNHQTNVAAMLGENGVDGALVADVDVVVGVVFKVGR